MCESDHVESLPQKYFIQSRSEVFMWTDFSPHHLSDLVYEFFPFCYEYIGWASSCLRAFAPARSSFCAWNTIPTSVHIILMIFKFSSNVTLLKGFPGDSDSKESTCNAGDLGLVPGFGRSAGEGNGNPLQYSCLENPMDRGAWWATVDGIA